MLEYHTVIVLVVLLALIVGVTSDNNKRLHARHAGMRPLDRQSVPCTNNPQANPYYPPCQTTAATASGTNEDATSESTSLERAHWCRFNNGTFLPLNQTYLNGRCAMCQCTLSRTIRCQPLECMPTYCIDNTMPKREGNQCCTQCANDKPAKSCEYNGFSYPHGTVMKAVEGQMQCWCQLGNVECRKYMGSIYANFDIWRDSAAIYIIGMILCLVVFFGLLLCCSSTLAIYLYYTRNYSAIQQAYNQYFNTGGWQPVEEEEVEEVEEFVEYGEKEKQFEAENYQSTSAYLPPPYAIVNDSYAQTDEQK